VWELTPIEAIPPERLIAGTGAGLTVGIDGGDWACRVGGFAFMLGIFSGCWLG